MAINLAERKKEILVVVLLVAAAGLFFYHSRSDSPLPDGIKFICAASGKTFNIDRDDIRSIPMENPKTGERTLLPFVERDGSRYVDSHYRGSITDLGEANKCVDPETLEVRSSP